MQYFSTRNDRLTHTAAQAMAMGIAPDGGLFVPAQIPTVDKAFLRRLAGLDYRARAVEIMGLYLEEFTREELEGFVTAAYADNFDDPTVAPLRFLDDNTAFLELWHGPTCAFKDMALQMLPHLLTASLRKTGEQRGVCILVATSGDTGKAALEGFRDVPGTRIFVFYPDGGVSRIQRLQMVTQAGDNVGVCAVRGNFDDAQTGVKKIFGDAAFAAELSARGWFLSSANSINWGRLLPQIVYYFSAYLDYVNFGKLELGQKLNFCVPTGNFGNILAGWFAARMGLPVGRFVCASNANNVLTEFLNTGYYNKNRPFHTTISPSMDILVSSNLERLLYLLTDDRRTRDYMALLNAEGGYRVEPETLAALQAQFSAGCCDDRETMDTIGRVFRDRGYLMDTHTAVAAKVLADYRRDSGDGTPAVVVSTASPFKFAADVLSALGQPPAEDPLRALALASGQPVPRPLQGLEDREVRFPGVTEREGMQETVSAFLR
ncbi:MAG: threonine synthase [Oscillospiraceae bacterium]|nr:threonine synthase [Oscillospiraceae bacterium]